MKLETVINPPQKIFEQIVDWTSDTEEWGLQYNDYNFWKTAFDQFWLFTVIDEDTSSLVASVSLARWDSEVDGPLYSIGMYYCVPNYRGQGHGNSIFKKAMEIVGDSNVTLTGVPKMWNRYSVCFGFNKYNDYWHLSSTIKMKDLKIPENLSKNQYQIEEISKIDKNQIHLYDQQICPRNREKIMNLWFQLKNTFSRVILNNSNQIVGYATIRIVSKNRLSAAPFYAENLEIAEVLLANLLENIPNYQNFTNLGFLFPETNRDAIRLCQRFSKENHFSCSPFLKSQFTQKFIQTPNEKVYSMSDCAHQFV